MEYEAKKSTKKTDLNVSRAEDVEPKKDEPKKDEPEAHEIPLKSVTAAQSLLQQCPPGTLPDSVKKQVVYSGKSGRANPPYPKGARLRLHYKAMSLADGTVYDDSRNYPKPMEFLVGKKFKMEVWELAVNTMFVGEVSKFLVPKEHCFFYPMVAKVLRNSFQPRTQHSSPGCCAHSMLSGTGYKDLDQLLKEPANMLFQFELLEVSLPGEFQMESWYMTDEQKAKSISELQEEGNMLYYKREFGEASTKYLEAVSRIEQLMNKETPGSPEMNELRIKKVPFLLNHAMCRQQNRDYYEAIQYNNAALEIDPENVKGLFRRGQCYRETAHWKEARADLKLALQLDSTLHKTVKLELEAVKVSEDYNYAVEKSTYQRMLQQKTGTEASKLSEAETPLEKQKRLVTELLAKTRITKVRFDESMPDPNEPENTVPNEPETEISVANKPEHSDPPSDPEHLPSDSDSK